jgi:hypothetical protein
LFDPTNTVELTKGDDGCSGVEGGTDFTYEVPIAYSNAGVILYLHQGCFSTLSCSGLVEYSLIVEASPVAAPSSAPADDDRYFDIRLCPLQECLDVNHPATGWNECDMCICEDFDKIFLSDHDHDCNADEEYYYCMVKYDVKTVTCKTQMKPGWIAAFFFIGLCGFICFASAFGYIIYLLCFARPNKPIQPMLESSSVMELQEPADHNTPEHQLVQQHHHRQEETNKLELVEVESEAEGLQVVCAAVIVEEGGDTEDPAVRKEKELLMEAAASASAGSSSNPSSPSAAAVKHDTNPDLTLL